MYFIYFSWWKDFRVPPSTPKVKVATAGKACRVWYEKLNTFQFKLPAGVCAADMTSMGTSGVHDFRFTLDSAKTSHGNMQTIHIPQMLSCWSGPSAKLVKDSKWWIYLYPEWQR